MVCYNIIINFKYSQISGVIYFLEDPGGLFEGGFIFIFLPLTRGFIRGGGSIRGGCIRIFRVSVCVIPHVTPCAYITTYFSLIKTIIFVVYFLIIYFLEDPGGLFEGFYSHI